MPTFRPGEGQPPMPTFGPGDGGPGPSEGLARDHHFVSLLFIDGVARHGDRHVRCGERREMGDSCDQTHGHKYKQVG